MDPGVIVALSVISLTALLATILLARDVDKLAKRVTELEVEMKKK